MENNLAHTPPARLDNRLSNSRRWHIKERTAKSAIDVTIQQHQQQSRILPCRVKEKQRDIRPRKTECCLNAARTGGMDWEPGTAPLSHSSFPLRLGHLKRSPEI